MRCEGRQAGRDTAPSATSHSTAASQLVCQLEAEKAQPPAAPDSSYSETWSHKPDPKGPATRLMGMMLHKAVLHGLCWPIHAMPFGTAE